MSLGQIVDVHVITNTGTVFSRIINAEHLDVVDLAGCSLEDNGYQMPRAMQGYNKLLNRDKVFAMLQSLGTPMNVDLLKDMGLTDANVEAAGANDLIIALEGESDDQLDEAATEALSIDSAVFESTPAWMQADLLFPYEQGFTFNRELIASGGLAAVDEAARASPALTVEALLGRHGGHDGPREAVPSLLPFPEHAFASTGARLALRRARGAAARLVANAGGGRWVEAALQAG